MNGIKWQTWAPQMWKNNKGGGGQLLSKILFHLVLSYIESHRLATIADQFGPTNLSNGGNFIVRKNRVRISFQLSLARIKKWPLRWTQWIILWQRIQLVPYFIQFLRMVFWLPTATNNILCGVVGSKVRNPSSRRRSHPTIYIRRD